MKRIQWLACVPAFALVVCVSMCAAARADEAQTPPQPGSDRVQTGEEAIRRALQQPTEVEFLDTPLRDALQYLQHSHNIRIWVNEQTLTDEGVAIDTPMTLSVSGVTLEAALEILLKPLQLDFMIEDEVLKITTIDEVKQTFQLEIYPVRDLLDGGFSPQELNELLTSSVSPQSWDNGQASMRIARGNLLVVRQTPRIQRELGRALEKLRAKSRPE